MLRTVGSHFFGNAMQSIHAEGKPILPLRNFLQRSGDHGRCILFRQVEGRLRVSAPPNQSLQIFEVLIFIRTLCYTDIHPPTNATARHNHLITILELHHFHAGGLIGLLHVCILHKHVVLIILADAVSSDLQQPFSCPTHKWQGWHVRQRRLRNAPPRNACTHLYRRSHRTRRAKGN